MNFRFPFNNILKSPQYIILFIVSIIGSLCFLQYGFSWTKLFGIIGLNALFSLCLLLVIKAFSFNKILYTNVFIFVTILVNLFCISDLFVTIYFNKPIDQDIVDIIADSNVRESIEFFRTYLPWYKICGYILLTFAVNVIIYWMTFKLPPKIKIIASLLNLIFVFLGISYLIYGAFNYLFYKNGCSIPQMTSVTRISHAYSILNHRINTIRNLYDICQNSSITPTQNDSTTYVVIIGESFSVYHSSLYGYDKNTNSKLKSRIEKAELSLFDDAISYDDHTHTVLKSIFSISKHNNNFENCLLFPIVFKKSNYKTHLYDNQYFVGNGISFLSDKRLSDAMFDYRNSHGYDYDGTMLDSIDSISPNTLIVIHLIGNHYTYSDRIPKNFECQFKTNDYSNEYKNNQKEIIAAYDNSILYNDSIIDAFMNRLQNHNVCLFYFSDHGEEVFEYGDYMGHGNAAHSNGFENQLRVPFMVWGSPSFRETDKWQKILNASTRKITTDDFAMSLIDLANIDCDGFESNRSFFNPDYIEGKRVVLNSINFDDKIKE